MTIIFSLSMHYRYLSYQLCCCLLAMSGWSSILTSLADGNITGMTNTYCCEYRIKTPDDGQ